MSTTDAQRTQMKDGKGFVAAGLKPTDRAEQVPLEGFCALAREVAKV